MAEILVLLVNRTIGNLKGDPVWVAPDGANWGFHESKQVWINSGRAAGDWPGKFIILKLPGVTVASIKTRLLEPEQIDVEYFNEEKGVRQVKKLDIRNRRRRIDIDNIPKNAGESNAMLRDGEITKSITELNANETVRVADTALEDEVFDRVKLRDPTLTRL